MSIIDSPINRDSIYKRPLESQLIVLYRLNPIGQRASVLLPQPDGLVIRVKAPGAISIEVGSKP